MGVQKKVGPVAYKYPSFIKLQNTEKNSSDELTPHRWKIKGATKATSSLHLTLAGLAVVKGAVRVPLLLLTTGPREVVVAASLSIPYLVDFQCHFCIEVSCNGNLFV